MPLNFQPKTASMIIFDSRPSPGHRRRSVAIEPRRNAKTHLPRSAARTSARAASISASTEHQLRGHADDTVARALEPSVSPRIGAISSGLTMVGPIDFNDQSSGEITEVDDTPVDQDDLPTKPGGMLAAPEPLPQRVLGGVMPLAHFSGMAAELEGVVKAMRAG